MIIRYLTIWSLLHVLVPSQSHIDRCLTGYMTDVQSWVDHSGRLTNRAPRANRIDVSFQNKTIQTLFREINNFQCSENTSVEYLSIARSHLQRVPKIFNLADSCGQTLSQTVTYLTLSGNDFRSTRSNRSQKETVSNGRHNITDYSWSAGFHGVHFKHLRELDLRHCGISELEDGIFNNMTSLEKLYLGENNISIISDGTFHGLSRLIHLDISRNDVHDGLQFAHTGVLSGLTRLNSLDLSYTKMLPRNLLALRSVSRSLQRLSICHSGLSSLGSNFFASTSLRFLDVSGNANILDDVGALRGLQSTLQVVYADGVALRSIRVFQNLTSLEILRVSNNEITTIERNTTSSLENLQVLIMDMNRVTTWITPIISLMTRLKFLSLRRNNINLISEEMMADFSNLSYVGVSGNNMVCNCNARELYELAARNEKIRDDVFIYPINNNEIKNVLYHTGYEDVNQMILERIHVESICFDGGCDEDATIDTIGNYLLFDYDQPYYCIQAAEGRTMSLDTVPFCRTRQENDYDDFISQTWNVLYLLIAPLFLLPICIFGYVFRQNIRYFFITMRNSAMLSLINKDELIDDNTIFNYDVFVSYCHEDRAWVLDQLLPHVEVDANVSVCLHERDFMVGLSILENIVSCMDRSKTILLILSKKFLLSQWCQFEMHLAQHRLLETRREDLVLVLLEDIPRRLRPNTLHYLMLTNTYIVWPKEEAEQVVFWRRLNKSLTTHKIRQSNRDSFA